MLNEGLVGNALSSFGSMKTTYLGGVSEKI